MHPPDQPAANDRAVEHDRKRRPPGRAPQNQMCQEFDQHARANIGPCVSRRYGGGHPPRLTIANAWQPAWSVGKEIRETIDDVRVQRNPTGEVVTLAGHQRE